MSDQDLAKTEKKKVSAQEEMTWASDYFVPEVDIYETADRIYLDADMPGVHKEDVSIDIKDDVLTVEGRIALNQYDGKRSVYAEYPVGNYYRRFHLSQDIDQSAIEANLANGVLTLVLPKVAKAQPRQIMVE